MATDPRLLRRHDQASRVAGWGRFVRQHDLGPLITTPQTDGCKIELVNVYLLRPGCKELEPCCLVAHGRNFARLHDEAPELLADLMQGARVIRSGPGIETKEVTAPDDWTTVPSEDVHAAFERLRAAITPVVFGPTTADDDLYGLVEAARCACLERENDLDALLHALRPTGGDCDRSQRFNLLLHAVTAVKKMSAGKWLSAYENLKAVHLEPPPLSCRINCPCCGKQHIDAPAPESGWTNPPHRSHLCVRCRTVFRTADVPTTGVQRCATEGAGDTWPPGFDRCPVNLGTRTALMPRVVDLETARRRFAEGDVALDVNEELLLKEHELVARQRTPIAFYKRRPSFADARPPTVSAVALGPKTRTYPKLLNLGTVGRHFDQDEIAVDADGFLCLSVDELDGARLPVTFYERLRKEA